jgi:hypothetical protein
MVVCLDVISPPEEFVAIPEIGASPPITKFFSFHGLPGVTQPHDISTGALHPL